MLYETICRLELYHHVQKYKNVIFFFLFKILFYIYNIQCLYKGNKAFYVQQTVYYRIFGVCDDFVSQVTLRFLGFI